jgi:hypothetical protein
MQPLDEVRTSSAAAEIASERRRTIVFCEAKALMNLAEVTGILLAEGADYNRFIGLGATETFAQPFIFA